MTSLKPALHGPDHLEGGQDPISAVTAPWALVRGSVALAAGAAGAIQYVDLSALVVYGLNDETDLYSLDVGSGGLAATHGIYVAEEGVYRIKAVYQFDTFTNGDTFSCVPDSGMGAIQTWPFTSGKDFNDITLAADLAIKEIEYLCFVGGTFNVGPVMPVATFPHAESVGAPTSTANLNVELFIEQLSRTYDAVTGTP